METVATIVHYLEVSLHPTLKISMISLLGHPQQEHETSHGSMSRTRWSIEGPDDTILELDGHRFGSNDDCTPVMCNLVCKDMGRHAHLDYCRSDGLACGGPELEHITERLSPNPDKAKDWVSHGMYWRRSGLYYSIKFCRLIGVQ